MTTKPKHDEHEHQHEHPHEDKAAEQKKPADPKPEENPGVPPLKD
jgi:hypothetical protein